MREVWILSYRPFGEVDAFEDYDEAKEAGVKYITDFGDTDGWDVDEINDEISEFNRSNICDVVWLQSCIVKEARQ